MENQADEQEQQNRQERQDQERVEREWEEFLSNEAPDRTIHVTASQHEDFGFCVSV